MDSSNPPQQPNHGEILTVKDIIDIITDLFDRLSKAELPIDPQITPVRDGKIRTDQKGNGSKGRNKKKGGWRFGKRKVNGSDNNQKSGSSSNGGNNTNENNGETGSSSSNSGNSNNENNHNEETGRSRHSDENRNTGTSSSSNSGNSNSENNGTGSSSSIHSSNSDSISTGRSLPNGYSHSSKSNPFEKLCSDLHYMKSTFNKLKEFEHELGKQTRILSRSLEVIIENMERDPASFRSKQIQSKLREITKVVFNLKCQIPLPHKLSSTRSDASRYHQNINGINVVGNRNYELPNLHMNAKFHSSSAFKEIQEIFSDLEINRKICLLCFAVFPENAQVKKRLLMYWWIGEGFVRPEAVEENVKEILKEFTVKGLIYPVNKKRTPEPYIFKMAPLVRSAVIFLAKNAGFFDYVDYGNPTMKTAYWNRTCLGEAKEEASRQAPENLEKLQTLFNVSERFPDFTFKWFSKMKELKVLYLGRWESTAERHIEVGSTEFLKDLRSMKQLRLLSFQGISRIEELHSSICKLSNLIILDLRACYNLEMLPDNIDSLKNLTHLDISECYLLDRMPKKLSSLLKLQVLKGFVINDAEKGSTCTLEELSVLKNLRKLSININRKVFILEDLISAFQNFKELQSLKLAWGG